MPPTSPSLPIHIRPGNLQTSSAIEAWVHRKLAGAFRRHGSKMTAVEVHFEDVNGPKHGAEDARCVMEARVNGRLPVAVQARARDLYAAIDAAAHKLDAALARVVERTDTRARRRFRQDASRMVRPRCCHRKADRADSTTAHRATGAWPPPQMMDAAP